MHCTTYPNLDAHKLDMLKDAEKELGTTLVAIRHNEIQPANMNEQQRQRIAQLESKLGVVLLAVSDD